MTSSAPIVRWIASDPPVMEALARGKAYEFRKGNIMGFFGTNGDVKLEMTYREAVCYCRLIFNDYVFRREHPDYEPEASKNLSANELKEQYDACLTAFPLLFNVDPLKFLMDVVRDYVPVS